VTGPKLNEGVLLLADVGDGRVSTKATARYLRGSASKARTVLDLIRGLDVRRADEVLQFTERAVARDVRKVLASAVANAMHNDNQDAEELFVLACFADEGPTLKRFRPRARGRASRIRKRTSHITVIVARMSDDRLEIVQARQASSTAAGRRAGTSVQSRRDRVARSRARAEGLRSGGPGSTDAAIDDETLDDETLDDDTLDGGDADHVEDVADETAVAEAEVRAAADVATTEADDQDDRNADDIATVADTDPDSEAGLPAGAVFAPEDGSVPDGYEIKGNASSQKFHIPGGRYYEITVAEMYFDTVESAEAAGYEAPAADATRIADDTESATASAPVRSDDEAGTGAASASEKPDASAGEPAVATASAPVRSDDEAGTGAASASEKPDASASEPAAEENQ